MFSDHFDTLISKWFLKNKKNYFDAFPSEKHYEKQPEPHSQTHLIGVAHDRGKAYIMDIFRE